MKCALWLNKQKVFSADEISENLDIAALRGYFLAGTLVPWLRDNGGSEYADRLEALDESAPDLNQRLGEIFGQPAPTVSPFGNGSDAPACIPCGVTLYFGSGGALGSFTLKNGSFRPSSFSPASFRIGSGYSEWQWEWLFRRAGSFTGSYNTSYKGFGSGGFHEWEWEWEWRLKRSGSFTSFSSFNKGWLYGSFNADVFNGVFTGGMMSSFPDIPVGSFRVLTSDEYDRIMYATLANCPLDRFGYGIHNI